MYYNNFIHYLNLAHCSISVFIVVYSRPKSLVSIMFMNVIKLYNMEYQYRDCIVREN